MIVATDLTLDLGKRRVLDRVSFTVAGGESVGLVGPNGSGKTSVLRCLLGLVPFTGKAAIAGHDVVAEPIHARLHVGYLPQKPAFGDLTAAEALVFVARVRRLDPARVPEVLGQVGLLEHARERARTFSGGMQQRLSLAVALLTDAPVLLLDEPTASLDIEAQETFSRSVELLRGRGRTLLLASHRAEELDRLTDRVLRLDRGRVADPTDAVARGRVVNMPPRQPRQCTEGGRT